MIDYLFRVAPFAIAILVYFVRIETRLASISRDLCWIKKIVAKLGCTGNKDDTQDVV